MGGKLEFPAAHFLARKSPRATLHHARPGSNSEFVPNFCKPRHADAFGWPNWLRKVSKARFVGFSQKHGYHSPPLDHSCGHAASLAFTRATVAAVHKEPPAGVGKPSAVKAAASARSDKRPFGSSLAMIGTNDPAWPAAFADRAARAFAVS